MREGEVVLILDNVQRKAGKDESDYSDKNIGTVIHSGASEIWVVTVDGYIWQGPKRNAQVVDSYTDSDQQYE